jgi:hypothetical protein
MTDLAVPGFLAAPGCDQAVPTRSASVGLTKSRQDKMTFNCGRPTVEHGMTLKGSRVSLILRLVGDLANIPLDAPRSISHNAKSRTGKVEFRNGQ